LTAEPQFKRTPDLYCDQTLASTATEIGLALKAFSRFEHPGTSTNPLILYEPPSVPQTWLMALYGYA
jgi:hypothetical protein